MASAGTLLQWTIVIFSGICAVLGILVVVESIFELEKFNSGSPDYTEKCLQIVMGLTLIAAAFVGCSGAVQNSMKPLVFFIIILLVLIISHVWRLWRHDENRVRNATEIMIIYTWIEDLVEKGKMDKWQEKYECCGQRGYTDYITLNIPVPDSCYHQSNNNNKTFYPYTEGCLTSVTTAYLTVYRMEKWFHISLIGVEVFGIMLTVLLICNMTKETLRYNY